MLIHPINSVMSNHFDTVGHRISITAIKMAVIDNPDNIYHWIANYFEQRGHSL